MQHFNSDRDSAECHSQTWNLLLHGLCFRRTLFEETQNNHVFRAGMLTGAHGSAEYQTAHVTSLDRI